MGGPQGCEQWHHGRRSTPYRPSQHPQAATQLASGDHVEEGDEVLAHARRQLLRQPKVQQNQLQRVGERVAAAMGAHQDVAGVQVRVHKVVLRAVGT